MEIKLTQNKVTIIDEIDNDLANYKWYYHNAGYVARDTWKPRIRLFIHRVIIERVIGRKLYKGEDVDHINNNGLDNRRCNLRVCQHYLNLFNRPSQANNKSGYKGVYKFAKNRKKQWFAQININKKRVTIGWFYTPEEAAKAYDKIAKETYGEFAYLNFPNG